MIHARDDYNRIQDPAGLIHADEPVFLIRSKDKIGPKAVEAWADLAARAGASPEIIAKARAHVEAMRAWQAEHGCKVPDVPSQVHGSKEKT